MFEMVRRLSWIFGYSHLNSIAFCHNLHSRHSLLLKSSAIWFLAVLLSALITRTTTVFLFRRCPESFHIESQISPTPLHAILIHALVLHASVCSFQGEPHQATACARNLTCPERVGHAWNGVGTFDAKDPVCLADFSIHSRDGHGSGGSFPQHRSYISRASSHHQHGPFYAESSIPNRSSSSRLHRMLSP